MTGAVPGAAPLPLQVWQPPRDVTLTVVVRPSTASRNDRCSSVSRSWPRSGLAAPAPRPPARRGRGCPGRRCCRAGRRGRPRGSRRRRRRPAAAGACRRTGCPTGAEAADLVVLLALGLVAEHVVGGRDLLEPLLRAGVGVRVVLLGQLAVGLGDLLLGRALGHPQTPCSSPSRTTHAGAPWRSPPHFDHRRPQHPPLPAVAGPQDLGHLLWPPVAGFVGDGVVQGGIERSTRPGRSAPGPRAPGRRGRAAS